MATDVTICNQALGLIGEVGAITSLTEPQNENARRCNLYYADTLRVLAEGFDWSFLRRYSTLAQSASTPPDHWTYEYVLPADCLVVRAIVDPATGKDARIAHELGLGADGRQVLWTNENPLTIRYTVDPAGKEGVCSAAFRQALSYVMAAKLAMPLTRNRTLAKEMADAAVNRVMDAWAVDANQGYRDEHHTPDWVTARD